MVAVLAAAFIAFSVWWLLYDHRIPGGGDAARHLTTALVAGEMIGEGTLSDRVRDESPLDLIDLGPNGAFFYPPLVHIIGGIPAALELPVFDWGPIALNLLFVPLLAAGCFGVGRLVYGPAAGVLAAAFALGTPMVFSMFHVFLLDGPLAGAVAIALWPLLASERFSRRRESVLAGALLGMTLLVKPIAPVFLAGPVAVMLASGGWREWRNVVLFGLAALVVAGPYYLVHLEHVTSLFGESTSLGQSQVGAGNPFAAEASYERFSLDNLAYYGWAAVNIQYFVPLLLLFVVGLALSVRELRQRPHLRELLAGLLVSYLAVTFLLSVRDPRYTLPMIVYVAVIATGWIPRIRRAAVQAVAVLLLVGAITLNVAAAASDRLPSIKVALPGGESGTDLVDPGTLTVVEDYGSTVGPPRPDRFWDRLLSAARDDGVTTARIIVREPAFWGTDPLGFDIVARAYGIAEATFDLAKERPELLINTWWTSDDPWVNGRGLPYPCGTVEEGARAPQGPEPVPVRVAVQRRGADGKLHRWCDF